jgi:hypothetical protein
VGSSAGRMVARKARRSRGHEPVQGSGSRPESARGVCGGSPQNRRVTWLSHKTKTGGSVGGDRIRARREASMPADTLVWESLVVNLGHWPSSTFGKNFIGSHSLPPPSGRLIGSSARGALCVFRALSLCELVFVSIVSSRCLYLRGPRFSSFK